MSILIEDWEKPSAYLRFKDFTEEQFRWEFLRRTPSYQTAWLNRVHKEWRESFHADSELKFGVSMIRNPIENVPPKFVDPTLIPAPEFLDENTQIRVLDFIRLSAARGHLLLSFDPRVSFDRNIDRLREEFDTEVSEWGITRRRETLGPYPDYLRIIDARAAGATFRAIQEQFASHENKDIDADAIRRVFARAKEAARKLTGAEWDA